ncbi:GNAT family N-acetyltransferase [Aeoliella sp. SH292]|uniref:GNAT family N-acetyltransferase n=1 Tax=Aeoliella sp. SH292 TaxID=3454464 RepID=UPI003F9D18A1
MTLRTIEHQDAPAILELWNNVASYDPLTTALLEEKVWGDPDFAPTLAVVDDSLTGFAVAIVRDAGGVRRAYLKLLAVSSRTQRQGLATRLLKEIEQHAASLGATELRLGEGAPNYLTPGVDARYAAAIAWAEKNGFSKVGETCNQVADLRDLPENVPAASLPIVRCDHEHQPSLFALLDNYWPSWKGEVGVALRNTPPTVFVALDNDRVVGFAAYDANNLGTGWFGPMGVDERLQGRGVGRALLVETLTAMRSAGYTQAIIPWVGPVEFYRRHVGAEISRTFYRFAKPIGV